MNLSRLLHFVIYFLLKPNETVFGLLQKLNFNPTSTSSVEVFSHFRSNTSTKGDIYNFDILVLADGLHRLKRYLKGDTTTTFTSSLGVSSLTVSDD
ncbi:hypothetical protein L2E82_19786 [Cichorium intybus]|uniref:Uncharacterized protein n=1 Tax=Cichorium intybus TaxID=13427 RepID=A0ACB9DR97_CICIN|nr:hypothetical protein L2E82_19786 [Cichorium intybus]